MTATKKIDALEETIIECHYLALDLRLLALEDTFIDKDGAQLIGELLVGWAKRQQDLIEAGRPAFRLIEAVRTVNALAAKDTVPRT
jgi:hypothetical protein